MKNGPLKAAIISFSIPMVVMIMLLAAEAGFAWAIMILSWSVAATLLVVMWVDICIKKWG